VSKETAPEFRAHSPAKKKDKPDGNSDWKEGGTVEMKNPEG